VQASFESKIAKGSKKEPLKHGATRGETKSTRLANLLNKYGRREFPFPRELPFSCEKKAQIFQRPPCETMLSVLPENVPKSKRCLFHALQKKLALQIRGFTCPNMTFSFFLFATETTLFHTV